MAIKEIEGKLNFNEGNVGILVSRWNHFITDRLRDGAVHSLKKHGYSDEQITIVYCPGSYEIPLAAQKMAETGKFDAIVAIGVVIRGATAHFDFVAGAANSGVLSVNHSSGIPVIFGVLTTDTIEQAIERAGTKAGNKGEEAAMAAIEMMSLLRQINEL
ncbi:MAG: 6,7-dimethyl-8-ribityllumazine synthase [Candidatus Cyclonatronum sp.]|uniref:6,7-dimethyl-8-ribityllumazine synthase n=1 Tax=Cyclonatronum sp. TaxID=3024185 RepID=UPI0025B8DD90|nr:6,7-dimethyl-8-ribityllumazine synthase [Cyclonatronum sp.]MCC5932828.1 6,7-dimethyl-8-ribityllumazine synthase [Balneolales bacterium]MCH8485618.1 6,7-dimethyl-8-ribityllumazine synthase [Cyclonatronum sp.]